MNIIILILGFVFVFVHINIANASDCGDADNNDSFLPTLLSLYTDEHSPFYQIEGPWNYGQPVHEVLTLITLRKTIEELPGDQGHGDPRDHDLITSVSLSSLPNWDSVSAYNLDVKDLPLSLHQFIRGVIWSDDPEGLFFDNQIDVCDFSNGKEWLKRFNDINSNDIKNYTVRSHFKDLQFFHSMASASTEDTDETRYRVLGWASFLAGVVTGEVEGDERLSNIKIKGMGELSKLFPKTPRVRDLFLVVKYDVPDYGLQQRALGALLHLIQDSYSLGHVERTADGEIRYFHNYNDPDHDKDTHKKHDQWPDGYTLRQRINNSPGMLSSIIHGSRILESIVKNQGDQKSITRYLRYEVFDLNN